MDIGSLKSKKLIVGLVAAIGILVNDAFGSPISRDAVYAALGVIATYILGQGIADHGAQGAAKAVERAVRKGGDVSGAVQSAMGCRPKKHVPTVRDEDDDDGPGWGHTSSMDDEDKPGELCG